MRSNSCLHLQGAPGGPNSQYYNHNYMQQYSPQAMLSYANQAAAYHNAALQNSRLSNPQHIADSIYNMTAQVKTVLILVVGSVLHIMLTFEYEKNSL